MLRVLEDCRGQCNSGPLIRRSITGNLIDRRDSDRTVAGIAKAARTPRRISPHSLWQAAVTNTLDASVPRRDVQIASAANLDRHAVPFLPAHVAGV